MKQNVRSGKIIWFQTFFRHWTMAKNVLVFSTNNAIKYLMMLNVMLFNGYLTVSVVLGIALGMKN